MGVWSESTFVPQLARPANLSCASCFNQPKGITRISRKAVGEAVALDEEFIRLSLAIISWNLVPGVAMTSHALVFFSLPRS